MDQNNMEKLKDKYGMNCIGNVIRILDQTKLIVNVGKEQLSVGDIIQIYECGEAIEDLDGTIIGNYEYIKGELKVIQIESGYSVCESNKISSGFKNAFAISPLLNPENFTKADPLNVESKDFKPLKIFDPVIRVGDPIKFFIEKSDLS